MKAGEKRTVRQISTSVSDFVLALSAFYVSYHWFHKGFIKAGFGLAIQGAAATCGVVKFAMNDAQGTAIFFAWKFLTFVATVLGVPLIAIEFCFIHELSALGNKITMFILVVFIVSAFLMPKQRALASQAVSGFSVLSVIIICFVRKNWFGFTAGINYVLAGLVFGEEGHLLWIPNVDSLHYLLAVANLLFSSALK